MIIRSKLLANYSDLEIYRKELVRQLNNDGLIILSPNFEVVNDELTEELKALVLEYDNKHSDDYYELLDKLKTLVIKYSN